MVQTIDEIKKKIIPVLKKNKITRAGIFGSYARGEQRKKSDIDILVEVKKGFSLLNLIKLELILKEILKRDVDLVTYGAIHPLLKNEILGEEVRII